MSPRESSVQVEDAEKAHGADEAAKPRAGCPRAREALGQACQPCPEREGALRRELLCRCPVALGLRLLVRIERFGADPDGLLSSERASLDFQERALARRLPAMDLEGVRRAELVLRATPHEPCALAGCLHCRTLRVLGALASTDG